MEISWISKRAPSKDQCHNGSAPLPSDDDEGPDLKLPSDDDGGEMVPAPSTVMAIATAYKRPASCLKDTRLMKKPSLQKKPG
eukprot:15449199-Alexandrium_andersonii.AAC.1